MKRLILILVACTMLFCLAKAESEAPASVVAALFSDTEIVRIGDIEVKVPKGYSDFQTSENKFKFLTLHSFRYDLPSGEQLELKINCQLNKDLSLVDTPTNFAEAYKVMNYLMVNKFEPKGANSYRPSDYDEIKDWEKKIYSARKGYNYEVYEMRREEMLVVDVNYYYEFYLMSALGTDAICDEFMGSIRDGITVPYEILNPTPVPLDMEKAMNNYYVQRVDRYGLLLGVPNKYKQSVWNNNSYSYEAGADKIWLSFDKHPADSINDNPCQYTVCTDENADQYFSERVSLLLMYETGESIIARQRYQLSDGTHALRLIESSSADAYSPEYRDRMLIALPDGLLEIQISCKNLALGELASFHMDRVISVQNLPSMSASGAVVTAAPSPTPTPKPLSEWETINYYFDMGGIRLAMPNWSGSNASSSGAERVYYQFGTMAEMSVEWYSAEKLKAEGAGNDLFSHAFRKLNTNTQQRLTYTDMQLSNGMRMVRGEDKAGLVAIIVDNGNGILFIFAESYMKDLRVCQEIADTIISDLMKQVTVVSAVGKTADELLASLSTPLPTATPVPDYTANGLVLKDKQRMAYFGRYETDNDTSNGTEKIDWTIVERRDGMALLVGPGLAMKRYHETAEKVTWETCDLRQWLNGEFYDAAFSDLEKSLIVETLITNPDNPHNGTDGGNDTLDRVFLLSLDEAMYYFPNEDDRETDGTEAAVAQGATRDRYKCVSWLTRTPGRTNLYVALISSVGKANYDGHYVDLNKQYSGNQPVVRPAVWVKIDEPAPEQADTFCQVGTQVYLGTYEQDNNIENGTEPIIWRVLQNENGKAMLISEYVLDTMKFARYLQSTSWEGSALYAWLNHDFYQSSFTDAEKNAILETETVNFGNPVSGARKGAYKVNSKVFCLSYKEANALLQGDTGRRAQPSPYCRAKMHSYYLNSDGSMAWFLRTQGDSSNFILTVNKTGMINTTGVPVNDDHIGVRPVVMVDVEVLRALGAAVPGPAAQQPAQATQTPVPQPTQAPQTAAPVQRVTQVPQTAAPVQQATQPPQASAPIQGVTQAPQVNTPVQQPAQVPQPTAVPVRQPLAGTENAYEIPARFAAANSYIASTKNDFRGGSVLDGNPETCWQFSTKKIKLGDAALEITLQQGGTVDELWIKNGFWKYTDGLDQYTRNCRPKKIGVSFRYEGESGYRDEIQLTLKDDKERRDWQIVPLGRHEQVAAVRIRVISIYSGTKYKTDVAISEVKFVEREGGAAASAPAPQAPAAAYQTLKRGNKGDEVLAMKMRMQELGYFTPGAQLSNSYNDTCVERVKQFQKRNGLPRTGIADEQTLALLYSDAALPKE